MIEQYIYERLKTSVTLVDSRVYPLVLPQDCPHPALTYQKISDVPEHAMGGDPDGATCGFQVDVWAETYGESKKVAKQVKDGLSRYSGDGIDDVLLINESDWYESDTSTFRVMLDFTVFTK